LSSGSGNECAFRARISKLKNISYLRAKYKFVKEKTPQQIALPRRYGYVFLLQTRQYAPTGFLEDALRGSVKERAPAGQRGKLVGAIATELEHVFAHTDALHGVFIVGAGHQGLYTKCIVFL
jgi:hypothetical protein